MNSAAEVWDRVLDILRSNLTSTAIATWFADCSVLDLMDNKITIYTPSEFNRDIIESRFKDSIKSALYELFSGEFDVVVLGGDDLSAYRISAPQAGSLMDSDDFTFERFVVGNSNKFAHAAAMAVSENPAEVYNPLFIYGDSGLGKTHLLYAIAHVVRINHPEYKIVYIKGDDFTNELIEDLKRGRMPEFREKYRTADLLLVDDIQFIAGKDSTQEEFFHTFNTLYESRHQIVLTSDRPPKAMNTLEDRLKTRFEWGLIADIIPPDYETRMAIIKNKAQQLGLILPEEVMVYIAENITANVRQIEGAVKKIMAYMDLMGDKINVSSVASVLKELYTEKSEFAPTADIIIEETARFYSVSPESIKSSKQTRDIVIPRHVSIYLIRNMTNLSLTEIGDIFNRHHATVKNSLNWIEENMKTSPELVNVIKDIKANINSRT